MRAPITRASISLVPTLTVFFAEHLVTGSCLHVAPVGAQSGKADPAIANGMVALAEAFIAQQRARQQLRPLVDLVLDHVSTTFAPCDAAVCISPQIANACAVLKSTVHEQPAIQDIALRVGLSPPALSRRFKDEMGISPQRYRRQARLAKATHLLLESGSIAEAAFDGLFADPSHFSRTFKVQYGISPSKWVGMLRP